MPPASLNQLVAFFFKPAGRAPRGEYILGLGFIFFLYVVAVDLVFGRIAEQVETTEDFISLIESMQLLVLPLLPSLFIITIRRCHDINLPGIFVLLLLVPVFGQLFALILAIIPGTIGANNFGAAVRYHPR